VTVRVLFALWLALVVAVPAAAQSQAANGVVATDAWGNPLAAIPATADDFLVAGLSGYEAGRFQVGLNSTSDFLSQSCLPSSAPSSR